jgi:chlorobactene glucosyltransferase
VTTVVFVALGVLPWVVMAGVMLWRLRGTRTLDAYPARIPPDAPLVSIIVPARDEARNVDACLRSILSSTWPALEVVVVNDQSTDATSDLARSVAAVDPRVRVVDAPDLPTGWFGKQWACHCGVSAARGSMLLFTDADTRHATELLARSMTAMRVRRADLLSIGGLQTMATFWERMVQPHVFAMIIARFGSPERMSRSTNPRDKIANGQFMLMSRTVYLSAGGHEAVRSHVAEDVAMAQQWTRRGLSVQIVPALDYMSTRMYHGLRELVLGWGKNIYAAGRETLALGPTGRVVLRVTYPAPALLEIVPAAVGLAALFGVVPPVIGAWAAAVYVVTTLYWLTMNHIMRVPLWYAGLHPLASVAMFGILARAAWLGDHVVWKGRSYTSLEETLR